MIQPIDQELFGSIDVIKFTNIKIVHLNLSK